MAWYAYCIAERQQFPELGRHRRPIPLAGVTGISGNQTFLFPASELAVIVSEHNPEEIATLNQQAAKDHARVIADCFKHSTVLPFRFNTTFADDDSSAPLHSLQPAPLRRQHRTPPRQGRDAPQGPGRRYLPRHRHPRHDRRTAVPHQPARERQPAARASVQGPRPLPPDASHVPPPRRGDHLQAHGVGKDAARYRPPDRQQDRRALPEQVLHRHPAAQGLQHAALRALAAVPLRPPHAQPPSSTTPKT